MKRICAWCRKDLDVGTTEVTPNPERAVSHGICKLCAETFFSQLTEPLSEFLDRLEAPVLLIEPEPRVATANRKARELLGKDLGRIEGRRAGEVIDCAYAGTIEGCGNHLHCVSCTIRNTVLETFASGKPFYQVPAYPDIQLIDGVKTFCFRISTEKIGNFVLLRIDDLRDEEATAYEHTQE